MNRNSEGVDLTITAPKFFQARSLIKRVSLKSILERANNFVDVFHIIDNIVTSQCDRVYQKFGNKNLLNQNLFGNAAELTKFL